jgi:hypothetical protein
MTLKLDLRSHASRNTTRQTRRRSSDAYPRSSPCRGTSAVSRQTRTAAASHRQITVAVYANRFATACVNADARPLDCNCEPAALLVNLLQNDRSKGPTKNPPNRGADERGSSTGLWARGEQRGITAAAVNPDKTRWWPRDGGLCFRI